MEGQNCDKAVFIFYSWGSNGRKGKRDNFVDHEHPYAVYASPTASASGANVAANKRSNLKIPSWLS
jgi:hypothetical protein